MRMFSLLLASVLRGSLLNARTMLIGQRHRLTGRLVHRLAFPDGLLVGTSTPILGVFFMLIIIDEHRSFGPIAIILLHNLSPNL